VPLREERDDSLGGRKKGKGGNEGLARREEKTSRKKRKPTRTGKCIWPCPHEKARIVNEKKKKKKGRKTCPSSCPLSVKKKKGESCVYERKKVRNWSCTQGGNNFGEHLMAPFQVAKGQGDGLKKTGGLSFTYWGEEGHQPHCQRKEKSDSVRGKRKKRVLR